MGTEDPSAESFGLIMVGSEVLDGRREDAHFPAVRRALLERNLWLKWCLYLPDDPTVQRQQYAWAFAAGIPFFSCGGIGSTPDDLTRQCVAEVLGVPLEHHPDGVAMLKERFGDALNEHRLAMVQFPRGAELIPNPVNRVPGFSIRGGHFVPGFPSMAHPMIRWVLDTIYKPGREKARAEVLLPKAREADLVPLMERFILAHPELNFSSLPAFAADGPQVRLGISGLAADVPHGLADLEAMLREAGAPFRREEQA